MKIVAFHLLSSSLSSSSLCITQKVYGVCEYYTMGKSFCKTSFQVGMDLKKVQKQGRDQRMHHDCPIRLHKHTADVGLSCCVLSSLPCFCTFFRSIPT